MNKVEQVARAIYADYENRPDYAQGQMNVLLAREIAISAIKAMREPDHTMTGAVLEPGENRMALVAAWNAMIDAALSEAGETNG